MTALALLFTLAAIGIAETTYLIRMRRMEEKPICPIGNDCHLVLTSKYNRLFGIHNDILGLSFYLAAAALTGYGVLDGRYVSRDTDITLLVGFASMLVGGTLFSLVLVFIQWRLVKAWCFWCLTSSVTVWLMTAIFFSSVPVFQILKVYIAD